MELFWKKTQSCIGLSISDHSVEMIQINKRKGRGVYKVKGWSRGVIPSGIIEHGRITNSDFVASSLKKIMSKPKFGVFDTKNVIFSIPESQVFSTEFKYPNVLKDDQIRDLLPNDIIKIIPFEFEEIYWDFVKTGKVKGDWNIFFASTPIEILNGYRDVIRKAGLRTLSVDIESAAINRSLKKNYTSKDVPIFVDIGAFDTLVFVNDLNNIRESYIINIGGQYWTKKISKDLKISMKDAEIKKRKYGLDENKLDGRIMNIVQSEIQPLIQRVKEIIDSYESKTKKKINKLILTGGGALIPKLVSYLSVNFDLKVVFGKTFHSKESVSWSAVFPCAIGLAMRGLERGSGKNSGIDFLRYAQDIEKRMKDKKIK